jgi:tRNA(Ile)-lysidine synthase TilS/MesJ
VISKYAKKDHLRVIFEEICYVHRITGDEVKQYLAYLEDRIHDIEEVIDSHIELTKDEIIQYKRE